MKYVLSIVIVAAGILLMLYPWISNWVYDHGVESTVDVYEKEVAQMDDAAKQRLLSQAKAYNERLAHSSIQLTDPFRSEITEEGPDDYYEVLNLDESGLMCFVDIPKIHVYLPVYHGTSAEVLERGVGHLEGSSLPIGGEGTHSILSAHTGMNSAKLFSDLTEMEKGDLFFVHVLDETLAYRVYDICVIEPDDTSQLVAEPGRDIVTLLTCTPYGVNSHRLLVKGERTEYSEGIRNEAGSKSGGSGSQWMQAYKKALLAGGCIAGAMGLVIKLAGKRRKRIADRRAERRMNG